MPLICRAGLDAGLLTMVGDASAARQGHRLPGTDIPIVSPRELTEARPDRVLLFLPDLTAEVRDTVPGIEDGGGRWVLLDPQPSVLEPVGGPAAGNGGHTVRPAVDASR